MSDITQLKKIMEKIEFSAEAKGKITEILDKAEAKGKLEAEDKEALLGTIKADMVLDTVEIKGYQDVLGEVDKLIAELKK